MTVNFSNNHPYNKFINITGETTVQSSNNAVLKQSVPLPAAVKVGDIYDDSDTKSGHSRKKIFGIIGLSVGSGVLLTLLGFFTLSKGFSAGFAKRLANLSDKIKSTIYELSAESKKLTPSQKLKLQFSKAVQPLADTMQASSNFTAIKDSVFHHWLKKLHLEPVINKVNEFFKNKIVLKTKNNAYQNAELSTIQFCNYLEKLAKKNNKPELAQMSKEILEDYSRNFSTISHFKRSESAWQNMSGLDEKVYNILFKKEGGFFKNFRLLKSYVTTDMVEKERNILQSSLNNAKSKISNNITDVYSSIKQSLYELKLNINPNDEKAVSLIKEISECIEAGKNLSGKTENISRNALNKKIKECLQELLVTAKNESKIPQKTKAVEAKIEKLAQSLSVNSTKKGLAQEAITLLKDNPQEYRIAKQMMDQMNGRLNHAISREVASYEKLAELQVGSVPTDILGILVPSAIATGLVIKSDSKDERISTTLTKGIPILGGIGVSYYGTTRGFTGAKNLGLGIATTMLLNLIGTKTNEFYKKYAEKQSVLKTAFEAFSKLQNKTHIGSGSAEKTA